MSRTLSATSVLVALCTLLAAPVHAAISRTYVASYGSDANTAYSCDFAHPCRTFQTAFSQTTTGGEILAVDGSGYGTLVIDRSVAVIANPGIFAGIGVFAGGTGVSIATAGVSVTLRGLTLNGQGGTYGINMTAGSKLSVENCVIANFSSGQYGIRVSTAATVRIIDTLVRDNERGAVFEGGATVSIAGSRFLNNSYIGVSSWALTASTVTTVSISDSIVTGSSYGFDAETQNGTATAKMFVIRSTATNNSYGVVAGQGGGGGTVSVVLSDSMVTGNATGLWQTGAGATLKTMGNNTVEGNTTPWTGTITAGVPM